MTSVLLQQKVEIFPERTKLDLKEVCQQHLLIEKKKQLLEIKAMLSLISRLRIH